MNEELRRRYVRDLLADLGQVGGARLEQWVRPLWDHLAGGEVVARGLNSEGAPVAGAVDAVWPDGSVSEASSKRQYFEAPYDKPRNDFRHALSVLPDARVVRLFCSRTAGPKASSIATRIKQRLRRRGFDLDLWDGRRIAEYIIDRLLLDERFVERVGDALPNLRRISEQNAASARVPALDPRYAARGDEESAIVERLKARKCLVLSGLGGIGKTELACAVAHRLHSEFELVIWVDGDRIQNLETLRAYDVRLNGYKLNILDLLTSSRTLLVLDNIAVDLDMMALASACGTGSRVLVTSQVEFGPDVWKVDFVDREHARIILSDGAAQPCPDATLDQILNAVGGHPLVLRMLNRFAAQGHNWAVVGAQCASVPGLPDAKRQTVASRILEQHLDVLGPELAFFVWCGSAVVDRALFLRLFGLGGLEKLERWVLTARGQSDAVRLHDIVFASARHIRKRLPEDDAAFENGLENYLASQLLPKGLAFFRVANRHRDLITARLELRPRTGALRYAYIHGHQPSRLSAALIGDPAVDIASGPAGDRRAWLLSIVEATEADYRRLRDLGERDEAKRMLTERLPAFDTLLETTGITTEEQTIVRHHRAKSLLKLGQANAALAAFEDILRDGAPHYPTKLQIARLSEKDPTRATALIFEIIEAELDQPGSVATSVLIDTLATLRKSHLRQAVPAMTERYGPFMAQQIKAAVCSGEDQPIRAFAGVGPEWSYKAPELFRDVLEVLEEIAPGTPEEAEDDDERVAIGRLLTAAGKMHLRDGHVEDARRRFGQSEVFFAAVRRRTGFTCTHHADALLRLGRAETAANVLDTAPREQREAFWLLRRTEAHLALGEGELALARIDAAIAREDLAERRPTFLAVRADVLHAMGNADHILQLEAAIAVCSDPKYRADLEGKLVQRRQAASTRDAGSISGASVCSTKHRLSV